MGLKAKLIGGKVYDTRTAEFVHWCENDYPVEDINYACETLYRTPGGEFFLHGEGGPRTSYARQLGCSNYSSGEAIVLLTPEEALEWMESREVDPDIISEYFELPQA